MVDEKTITLEDVEERVDRLEREQAYCEEYQPLDGLMYDSVVRIQAATDLVAKNCKARQLSYLLFNLGTLTDAVETLAVMAHQRASECVSDAVIRQIRKEAKEAKTNE